MTTSEAIKYLSLFFSDATDKDYIESELFAKAVEKGLEALVAQKEDGMFNIKRDETVKRPKYYCVLGVSKRKVIYGGTPEIVHRKCMRAIEKGEVSFEPFPEKKKDTGYDIPF